MDNYKPVVGEECEVFNQALNMPEWEKCKPLFIGEFVVVYTSESCLERTARIENVDFRPIRTQEEVEREEAIEAMSEYFSEIKFSDHLPVMLGRLYDAGYHNGPKVGEKVESAHLQSEFESGNFFIGESFSLALTAKYDIYRKVEK